VADHIRGFVSFDGPSVQKVMQAAEKKIKLPRKTEARGTLTKKKRRKKQLTVPRNLWKREQSNPDGSILWK